MVNFHVQWNFPIMTCLFAFLYFSFLYARSIHTKKLFLNSEGFQSGFVGQVQIHMKFWIQTFRLKRNQKELEARTELPTEIVRYAETPKSGI